MKKIEIPKEELETLCKWMSKEKIADRYRCHVVTIERIMREYGINPPIAKERPKDEPKPEPKERRRPLCPTCQYRGTLGADNSPCCDYLFVTGHRRNSDPGFCDKYEKGTRKQTNNILYARRKNENKGDSEKT